MIDFLLAVLLAAAIGAVLWVLFSNDDVMYDSALANIARELNKLDAIVNQTISDRDKWKDAAISLSTAVKAKCTGSVLSHALDKIEKLKGEQ